MNLTKKLKNWAIQNTEVTASASEDEFRKAVGDALSSGELSAKKFLELSTTEEDEEVQSFKGMMSGLGEALGELKDLLLEEKDADEGESKEKGKKEDDAMVEEDEEEEPPAPKKGGTKSGVKGGETMTSLQKMISRMSSPMHSDDDGDEKSINIRVKEAADQYATTKSALTYPEQNSKGRAHPLAGKPVKDFTSGEVMGRTIDAPSDLDKAVAGSFAKFLVNSSKMRSKSLAFQTLPQHDKELLLYAMDNMKWSGASDGGDLADIKDRKLSPREQKALIDDSTSGGLEAAPIVFDDQIIQTPLLNGELFPLVNSIPLDRGRRIEGVATGTVTGSWGGVDDTAISLFNTASYVSAFDTTIFRWEGAIRIGLDFLSDTPIDFGQHITAQYGERLLEDLDDVIATGNGTTQPEGVTVKSGTTSINFGGSTTIGNYESLRFGVAKPEHRANLLASAVFCGSETSYMRAKAIPVGASDARRLTNTINGASYDDYRWMDRPYKINESLGNQKIFYAILARYRMYRRRGLTIRTSTEGDTLIRNNEMLIVATARYGGQLERGAVAAVTSTAPA